MRRGVRSPHRRPSTLKSEGAKFDTPRTFGHGTCEQFTVPPPVAAEDAFEFDYDTSGDAPQKAPPVWDDEPAYPGERRYIAFATRHPRLVEALAAAGVVGLWLLFVWTATRK